MKTWKRSLGWAALIALAVLFLPADASAQCNTAWAPNVFYNVGAAVSYNARNYTCRQAHTSQVGWEPPNVLALWTDNGACSGGATPTATSRPAATATATARPTATPTGATATPTSAASATATATATATGTATPTTRPTATPTSGSATCAVKSRPGGKVLQGYWETWDGSAVHPGMGHISIGSVPAGYNVINVAFPIILSDGTVVYGDDPARGEDVPSPAEMCSKKAAGATILLSIGGATAGIDLSSATVADRFINTIVPVLQTYNFDGIDIDIETGLVAGSSMSQLSTSQTNLIRIIDGVLARMPSNFGLTMAPETAYVTGGSVTYGSIWGAYLPIVKKYNEAGGRGWWLNMQYYNGSMYGCSGDSYSAATVQGFVVQTQCLASGLTAGGQMTTVPYDKQVPGLPAQPGAGGGYMSPSLVSQAWSGVGGQPKGLMTWSINWDGSLGWDFLNTKPF